VSDWTWKQAVADEVIAIVNQTRSPQFTLDDLYAREVAFQIQFPRNRHVREKVRQTLQRLRDTGLITFLGEGRYSLNLGFGELDWDPSQRGEEGIEIPGTVQVVRQVRLRNTLLAADLKERYEYCCQVCRTAVQLVSRKYAEAHHIRPLGSPHFGRDVEGNILVLCPNHHVMLDRGAISIEPTNLLVQHIHRAFEPRRLHVAPWHTLDTAALLYYGNHVYGN